MVEQLKTEYRGQPVIFIEDNVDFPVGARLTYFWAAQGGGTVFLPMTIVDSGHQHTSGYINDTTQHQVYSDMIDAELARAPQAMFDLLTGVRSGSQLYFNGRVTNLMVASLPATARVHVLVYEQHTAAASEHLTTHILRAHVWQTTGVALPTNSSVTFAVNTAVLTNIVDWSKVHAVALVDYRPGGASGPYDMLQAANIYPINSLYLPFMHK